VIEQKQQIKEMAEYGPNQIWGMLDYTIVRSGRYKRQILDKKGKTVCINCGYDDELTAGYGILIEQNVIK
jgi:hypothetical protein